MINNVEYIFMCLLAIHVSSLLSCQFKSFAHLFSFLWLYKYLVCLSSSCWIVKSSLYTLDMSSLSYLQFGNIFPVIRFCKTNLLPPIKQNWFSCTGWSICITILWKQAFDYLFSGLVIAPKDWVYSGFVFGWNSLLQILSGRRVWARKPLMLSREIMLLSACLKGYDMVRDQPSSLAPPHPQPRHCSFCVRGLFHGNSSVDTHPHTHPHPPNTHTHTYPPHTYTPISLTSG